jgi:TfoX/Sxy family transcriptional regulator of competence genes
MSTQKEFVEYIVDQIQDSQVSYRAMFGEYALYYAQKVVALICGNTLFVKITPSNEYLLQSNEVGPAYPGAKNSYIIEADQIEDSHLLKRVILNTFSDLPEKSDKKVKGGK